MVSRWIGQAESCEMVMRGRGRKLVRSWPRKPEMHRPHTCPTAAFSRRGEGCQEGPGISVAGGGW